MSNDCRLKICRIYRESYYAFLRDNKGEVIICDNESGLKKSSLGNFLRQ